jgi:hypothetical protein
MITDLERLTVVEDLRTLKARYCRLADEKRWDEFSELFTEDAEARFFDPAGELVNAIHSPRIGASIGARVGAAQPIHHVFSHELEVVSPTEARGIWAMEDIVEHPDGAERPFKRMHGFGHYHETYERQDGTWRIRTLEQTRVRVDYTN